MPGTPAPGSMGGRIRSVLAKLLGGAIRDDGAPTSPSPDARAAGVADEQTAHPPTIVTDPAELVDTRTDSSSGVGPDEPDTAAKGIAPEDTVVTVPHDAPAPSTALDGADASWTVVRLRGRARELGIRGYSAMSKAQLLRAIAETER